MPTLTTPPATRRRPLATGAPSSSQRGNRAGKPTPSGNARRLARYPDSDGRDREVVAIPGAAESLLVIDRHADRRDDERLVAHIAADEPAGNAELACTRYLEDARRGVLRCRSLTFEDSLSAPFAGEHREAREPGASATCTAPVDAGGRTYRLARIDAGMRIPELRWCRYEPGREDESGAVVSVREAIAGLQSYEPVSSITRRALGAADAGAVSSAVLRSELERVQASPIVLNRLLRETVLAAVQRQGLSMSEIAIRCGRVKHDRRGNASGETSWLARRLGLLPEGGHSDPTPWIHSDVLALIARRGLGVSPREVELG